MRLFQDTESGEIISEKQLEEEFTALKEQSPDEYNYSFGEYIKNCTNKNGFLKEINQ